MPAHLADGSTVDLDVHSAIVVWHGSEVPVEVLATGNFALLGTLLLRGSELWVQFTDDGLVTIEPI